MIGEWSLKNYLWFVFVLGVLSSCNNKQMVEAKVFSELEIVDLSETQLRLFTKSKSLPTPQRDQMLLDSLYHPYTYLWTSYLGTKEDFTKWANEIALREIELYKEKAKQIDLAEMNRYFNQTAKEMTTFTGFRPKGKWYIFWGPKWTDLGGIGNGTMLIDLANQYNKSLADIVDAFPHELNHQIYDAVNPHNETYSVISRVVDEGFAVYVSHKFRMGKTGIADELGFTDEEYQKCIDNEDKVLSLIKGIYNNTEKQVIDQFVNRGFTFKEGYPGAIGYYIGLRIVQAYVSKHGKDSWKDIYKISAEEVLKESGIYN